MFTLQKIEGHARRGVFETVHGTIQTPFFMNVGTAAAIKGGISSIDLESLKCQVELCNTYHLHLRPGDKIVRQMGGLHQFMNWNRPILTDSGGFQVFSLAKLRRIKEEGVYFQSHIDGKAIFMGPEESMQIQSNLGSTIAMAFDECVENPAPLEYVKNSCARTTRWLIRCQKEMQRLNSLEGTINPQQIPETEQNVEIDSLFRHIMHRDAAAVCTAVAGIQNNHRCFRLWRSHGGYGAPDSCSAKINCSNAHAAHSQHNPRSLRQGFPRNRHIHSSCTQNIWYSLCAVRAEYVEKRFSCAAVLPRKSDCRRCALHNTAKLYMHLQW